MTQSTPLYLLPTIQMRILTGPISTLSLPNSDYLHGKDSARLQLSTGISDHNLLIWSRLDEYPSLRCVFRF